MISTTSTTSSTTPLSPRPSSVEVDGGGGSASLSSFSAHGYLVGSPLLDLFLGTTKDNDTDDAKDDDVDVIPRLDSSMWEYLNVRDLCRLRYCSKITYRALEVVEYNRCRDGRGESIVFSVYKSRGQNVRMPIIITRVRV